MGKYFAQYKKTMTTLNQKRLMMWRFSCDVTCLPINSARPDDMNFLEGVTSRHRHSNSTPNSDKFRYSADTVPTLLDMRFILSVLALWFSALGFKNYGFPSFLVIFGCLETEKNRHNLCRTFFGCAQRCYM